MSDLITMTPGGLAVPDRPRIPFVEGDGTGPDIWMNLQKNYELRLAEKEMGEALKKIPQHHVSGAGTGVEMHSF